MKEITLYNIPGLPGIEDSSVEFVQMLKKTCDDMNKTLYDGNINKLKVAAAKPITVKLKSSSKFEIGESQMQKTHHFKPFKNKSTFETQQQEIDFNKSISVFDNPKNSLSTLPVQGTNKQRLRLLQQKCEKEELKTLKEYRQRFKE